MSTHSPHLGPLSESCAVATLEEAFRLYNGTNVRLCSQRRELGRSGVAENDSVPFMQGMNGIPINGFALAVTRATESEERRTVAEGEGCAQSTRT